MENRKKLIVAISLVLAAALMACAYFMFMPKGTEGKKAIAVKIVNGDTEKTVSLKTDEAYLRGALEGNGLIAGDESEYGLFVKTVDGYTVNDANQEWWSFTCGGEFLTTGVDTTPIADGDSFEITLMAGY